VGETTGGRPLRVLLADPAPMHRSGLRMVLSAASSDVPPADAGSTIATATGGPQHGIGVPHHGIGAV
jgi:hypothetical protein